MVMMSPHTATTNSAPAERRTSRTGTIWSLGAPLALASVEKLYTTVALLRKFPSTMRLNTTLLGTGHQTRGGTWRGNLYVHGDGDPGRTLSGRRLPRRLPALAVGVYAPGDIGDDFGSNGGSRGTTAVVVSTPAVQPIPQGATPQEQARNLAAWLRQHSAGG